VSSAAERKWGREKGRATRQRLRARLADPRFRCLYCPDCGDGPFVGLATHVTRRHGRARRREMEAEGVVMVAPETSRLMTIELAERGVLGKPRQKLCGRGHALVGRNVLYNNKTKDSRTCRACRNERLQRLRVTRPARPCAHCHRRFTPRGRQQYCGPACRQRAYRQRRSEAV